MAIKITEVNAPRKETIIIASRTHDEDSNDPIMLTNSTTVTRGKAPEHRPDVELAEYQRIIELYKNKEITKTMIAEEMITIYDEHRRKESSIKLRYEACTVLPTNEDKQKAYKYERDEWRKQNPARQIKPVNKVVE